MVLEDETGRANPVDDRTFREFFTGCKETRLAVLNACQSAAVSSSQPLVGLAPRLLQRQLSAVVAMQHPMPNDASLIFTREFYRSLALGHPVDAAVSEARKGIFLEMGAGIPAWGTPVLFLRAKDGQLFRTQEAETEIIELPAPPEPVRPPELTGFVGRDAELAYYAEKLDATHIAVIAGMAGMGKTALAVKLLEWVADDRDRVFWHSFHEGEGIEATIWSLAGFLAWHGRDELWKLLQSARLTGGQPPPVETLLDYVLQLVRGGRFLLCFDDFHHVDDDPVLNQFVQRLRDALVAGDVSIVVTSRRVPDFATLVEWRPLAGLTPDDARRLLMARDVALGPPQIDELYRLTAGNAEFLTLAIDALRQARDPDQLLSRLAESDDVERYLLQEVDEGLTGQERSVMTAVAALLGYAGTRDAIETILNGGNVWRTLRRLAERHLLTVQDGTAGREYGQHAIVRAFYYDLASLRQRRQLHRRAGEYYEVEEPDLLRAGLHFEGAREYERAAQLATRDVRTLINRGQARALLGLLARFEERQVEAELWAEVNLARAQIYTMQQEKDLAHESHDVALRTAASLADLPVGRVLQARICLGMGELLQMESPQEALGWLRQGLEAAAGENRLVEAELHIRAGYTQMLLGDYAEASAAVERGLNLLPEGASQLRSFALLQMGSIASAQGNSQQGQQHTRQALEIAEQVHDPFQSLYCLINLAIDEFLTGNWSEAIADFQKAETLAERLGHEKSRAFLDMNLGEVSIYTGDHETALNHLQRSLARSRRNNDRLDEVFVQPGLAQIWLRTGEYGLAREALVAAEDRALELDAKPDLAKIHRVWAELELASGKAEAALDHAQRSVDLAESLGEEAEKGIGLRVKAQAMAATGRQEEALSLFEQSLTLLEQEPYEAARTKMYLGLALAANGPSPDQARVLLEEAQRTFQQLGAKYDLAHLEEQRGRLAVGSSDRL